LLSCEDYWDPSWLDKEIWRMKRIEPVVCS
jgi:hypothetical protein